MEYGGWLVRCMNGVLIGMTLSITSTVLVPIHKVPNRVGLDISPIG
ncbi:hypothetical protein KDAU_36870 [Dictyobacter aurantiacus]|uniref:Uncharacterized protein n=1 Tax=Dictyobacter aurantiacus TaxID=1936993 RepID=A0A401ZHU4_9CHLR|nr:hypothetical protein KDAU_36870 [Dictyobacter aurantiacus]